jgi:general secretion pathway protein L
VSELWIRFADPDFDAFQWWRFDADGQGPGSRGEGQGDALAGLEPAATCRVFVPQTLLLTLRARLPPKASRQQIQAIGFAIEDQLANDVEDNHYATGPQQADGSLAVVVIERAAMDRLIERLRAARLRHDFIHPEMLLCPAPGDDAFACLCAAPGGWLLRLDEAEALAVPDTLLADSLPWIRSSRGMGEEAALDCCATVNLPDSFGPSCREIRCEFSPKMLSGTAVSLLQGDYLPAAAGVSDSSPGDRWRCCCPCCCWCCW